MFHRAAIVNAFSGYYPPHYLPLAHAVRHRHYEALRELVKDRTLGVAVDRSRADTADVIAALERADGIARRNADNDWATFSVQPATPVPVRLGERIAISALAANRHGEDVGRMLDGSIETAWGSGLGQTGDEDVTLDLGSSRPVGSIVLGMGSYAFGFPRQLEIEVSADASQWTPVWSGETSVSTVRAAVASPTVVPLTLAVGRDSVRHIRLRQRGTEPGIPWWIAELSVHAPAK
jgi:hypothetical protein